MAYVEGRVQRCDNHNGIGYATLSDNLGNIASADVYGFWYTSYAYPGYALTASAGGLHPKTHSFTSSDVSSGWVTICLDPKPPTTTCCFDGETVVTMADGSEKPIAAIAVGDRVLGWSGAANRVLDVETPLLGNRGLFAINDGRAFFTAEHPFWTQSGWKALDPTAGKAEGMTLEATPMVIGDRLSRMPGQWRQPVTTGSAAATMEIPLVDETVMRIAAAGAPYEMPVYNLILDGDNTYFANGYLVHNKGLW
ncbi:Hint domain-containing protein [Fodinicurvata sp. EGI_FJ10296]|uniref:Hint domain-containing protein n=1 Tax=Fodinicurvata sp. EGI_FJ10296 TaxID=3231908 RepID=UPI003455E146